jgi:glutathione S-transferase
MTAKLSIDGQRVYRLYIGNKNYSSWSLRPWVLMRELKIPFEEHLMPFGEADVWQSYRRIARSGKVPCLLDDDLAVGDSLSITEYLAERHPGVWPSDARARAWARSAAAEMHSGFNELRNQCSMNCGVRVRLHTIGPGLESDLGCIGALWQEGLNRFGGPYLAGGAFSAADAFYAPVAFRILTYGLSLDSAAAAYVTRLLNLESMKAWYADAVQEPFRDLPHEEEIRRVGTVLEDQRKNPN